MKTSITRITVFKTTGPSAIEVLIYRGDSWARYSQWNGHAQSLKRLVTKLERIQPAKAFYTAYSITVVYTFGDKQS